MLKTAQILETRLARSFFNTAAEQGASIYHDSFGNMYYFDRAVKGKRGDEIIDVPPPMVKLLIDGIDKEEEEKTDLIEGVNRTSLLNHYRIPKYLSIFDELRSEPRGYQVRGEGMSWGAIITFKRFYILDSKGKALLEVVQDVDALS